MRRLFALAAALALSACVTIGTPGQTMYEAYGAYSAALAGAVEYAESPTASPAVVARLNLANRSEGVQTAVKYGRAYTLCRASNQATVAGVDCAAFDFSNKTASGYIATLRVVVAELAARTR